ncbi:MAG TPA: hypothetical protein VME43_08965 [Bryobacteraceae bacterium]|nr:hypothetical protein [Bryobacteraceae bacterium]
MTIALGILASDGVVIAADAQETSGYFKGFALKIHEAMTQTSVHSTVQSAIAVTGAGPGVYLDGIAEEIIRKFHGSQDSDIASFELHLKETLEDFYARHVANKPSHIDRTFELIVGAQIEGSQGLWVTEASVVKPSLGFEAIGAGHPFARMAIQNRALYMDAQSAAILSVLGVTLAKEYDQDCGKGTMVVFLKDNLAYTVPPYLVQEAEKLFARYAGIEHSAFLYALGKQAPDDLKRPRKINGWLRQLRKDFSELAAEFLKHKP